MADGEKKISNYDKRRRAEKWILLNSQFLKLTAIGRELDFPKNSLQQFVKDGIPLSKERIDKLYPFVEKARKLISYDKRKRAEKWILSNSKFLRLRAIERELDFPLNTLQKFVKNNTSLNKERAEKLNIFIIKSRKY